AGGVSQLGVVVIAEDVVEVPGGRSMGVDVRVRIDQGNAADFREQVLGQTIVRHGWKSLGRGTVADTQGSGPAPLSPAAAATRPGPRSRHRTPSTRRTPPPPRPGSVRN